MANRIVGNVYILDSTGNLPYINSEIAGIGFYGTDTTARLVIGFAANASNSIVAFAPPVNAVGNWDSHKAFNGWRCSDSMSIVQLVAGTGWVYLQ